MQRERLGGLDCIVAGGAAGSTPTAAAVFCHGFGAPGTDLVPLASVLARSLGPLGDRVQFIFPAAPLSLANEGIPGGRAWWPIDMVQLQIAMATGDFRDLKDHAPELLPEMNSHVTRLIGEVGDRWNLPESRIVVGGFSQGAMLSTDVALRMPGRPGGLVIWSGTLLNEAAWGEAASQGAPLTVVQSHAVDDPILPFTGAEELRDLLTRSGHTVDFFKFRGGHTIPDAAIAATVRLLERLLTGTPAA
jgi:phospholipase/carboxylesterase